jgi:sugar lactone lactonase YvrE
MFLLVSEVTVSASTPIPADKRIEAIVIDTLAAPDDNPMHMPTDVAVDRKGRIYVADGVNDRILCFRPNGKFMTVLCQWGDDKLNRPVGLTVDAADRLWIADTGNHRLLVVSADGKLVERIDLAAFEGEQPFDPTDLAVTADGKRTYIVDNDNHRIVIRDNQTGKLTSLGQYGRSLGRFQWPFMVSIGPKKYVFVSEAIGARLQRISPSDRWDGVVGQWGVELGRLYRPKGVVVDDDGHLYVSDSTLGVVQVFDLRGRVKGVLTDAQKRPLRFEHPMGMCIDAEGKLYVVELWANRVAVVSLKADSKTDQERSVKVTGTGGRR